MARRNSTLYGVWNHLEAYGALFALAVATVFGAWNALYPFSYNQFANSTTMLIRGAPSSMVYLNWVDIGVSGVAIVLVFVVYVGVWRSLTGR